MDINRIYQGDCLTIMKDMPDNSIDCIITDPPYGYSFMGKDWDRVVIGVDYWKECLRVLKSGAFAFIMSAPRQDVLFRMIENLDKAGFVTGFTSIYWTYASGFPKASNIGKMVDKKARRNYVQIAIELGVMPKDFKRSLIDWTKEEHSPSNKYWEEFKKKIPKKNWEKIEREIVGRETKARAKGQKSALPTLGKETEYVDIDITKPATDQAKALDGSYGGFQPKPALELILVVMKPLSEKTYVEQAMKNGKGITWLDKCRIPGKKEWGSGHNNFAQQHTERNEEYKDMSLNRKSKENEGRFPPNLLVSDDVLNDGTNHTSGDMDCIAKNDFDQQTCYGKYKPYPTKANKSEGSFSRYFDLDKWYLEKLKNLPPSAQKTFPFLIVPKASKGEKNEGCEDIEPQQVDKTRSDPNAIGCNNPRNRGEQQRSNFHPTVKSVKLMSYLVTLGSRKGDVILDPFLGSGTTAISAESLGRKWIGIEKEKEYVRIAEERIKQGRKQLKLF